MTDKLFYSYNNIHNIIVSKSDFIKQFNPDIILAIGGGGLIPARIIRSFLDKPILVVTLSSYDDEEYNNNVKIVQWINDNFENKKILIVDEIDDTRRTLEFCVSELRNVNKANEIGIFVVHNKMKDKCCNFENMYYISGEDIEDKWVVYPWDSDNLI